MLSINSYPPSYVEACHGRIAALLTTYDRMLATAGPAADTVRAFEHQAFNNMVLALDGYFGHRARAFEGKDGNPLNEVRILCAAMMHGDGVVQAEKTIKYDPARTVLKYRVGDRIALSRADFEALSDAFFAEIVAKYP